MEEPIKTVIDGKQITLFRSGSRDAPVVYANMYQEAGRGLLTECENLGCKPFHLVSITNLRWDEELSPWPHAPMVSREDRFTGEADGYARCLVEKILPYAEEKTGTPDRRILAGYSMAGLFALYALYVTDVFSGAVAASGSLWYPGFLEFVRTHTFLKPPDAVYLSIGDRECRTKNGFLCQNEHCMEEVASLYLQKGIPTVFERNPGGHGKNPTLRLAKGIARIL